MNWKKYLILFILFIPLTYLSNRSTYAIGGQVAQTPFPSETKVDDQTKEPLTEAELNIRAQLDRYFMQRFRYEGFNGVVLIAHNGRPIYEQTFGYADISSRKPLNPNTPFELASVSKTFTATAVLKLAEQGTISLDNPVKLYFPDFPYEAITIRQLISHRSGLQDYVYMDNRYITDRKHYMNNDDVVEIFCKKRPSLLFSPNSRFEYSNSNFALLAAIVSKVTGMKFQQYMRDSIFQPLGMMHSYVFDFEDTTAHEYAKTHDAGGRKLRDVCFDGAVGDKGVFSTAEDMLIWDNALRSGKILSEETQEEAYKPRSLEASSFANYHIKNYGYGWRMQTQPDGTNIIYHNGWWHGNNNVFARNLKDNTTIIVLGNRLNQGNYYTDPIWNMLKKLRESGSESVAER
jgi:CubicO group peptidase (beta-lactamase class C family)